MKNILLIGVGGTGSKAVDIFYQKKKELGNQAGNKITALVFDTDAGDLQRITEAKKVVMADKASVGTICDRFGKEFLREWFPVDDKAIRAQEMVRGASQWRKKSYLAFLNLMNKPLERATFISALEEMTIDPNASCEIYVIASIAGGTGSGSFIPIALYAKRYLRRTLGKDPIVNAMIALPDIYANSQTPENKVKVYANAYAILRELNAINLVSRNYNAGIAAKKKAPIRFKIGDANEPNVGLLFDASDKSFWTPEAAPFSQIFLLDRIPGLNSVTAHDIVLANSLYTILCTDIGSAFDSEFSNHELLRSQNNGSNAIYAGISTSQIRFPKDSVLDYLAYRKTCESCDKEWLILHKQAEAAIKAKEDEYKAAKRHYSMKEGDYAKFVLDQLDELIQNDNDAILSIVERGVDVKQTNGEEEIVIDVVKNYIEVINKFINDKISKPKDTEAKIFNCIKAFDDTPKQSKNSDDLASSAKEIYDALLEYYQTCIDDIKRTSKTTAESIFTLDRKKEEYVGKTTSLVENVIKSNDKFIHPVAAMILLCRVRLAIAHKLDRESAKKEWEDLKRRNVDSIAETLLEVDGANVGPKVKSAYLALGSRRFAMLSSESESCEYTEIARTDYTADCKALNDDALSILSKIYRSAQSQFRAKIYSNLARDIDILIAKYRNFFNRFEKEKEDLLEDTKTAHRKDSGTVDSIINVYSTKDDKDTIYKAIVDEGGPITDAEIAETDNIVGGGVFAAVYSSAACEFAQDDSYNDKDSGAYRSLFANMVAAYRESIAKSEEFELIASYNVIEAMVASQDEGKKDLVELFKQSFSVAQEFARPAIRLDSNESECDLVRPSDIMVFMMSVGTGRYLKKHAEELGLHLPADQTNEYEVIKACAEEFIRKYSGNNSARVSIVSSMSDQVLYCTGEIMDITPLRIAKFNELGDENTYFKNYSAAIDNYKKYGTDMWNPHLGNNLHKRGYLPYMNEEMEKECDVKVVKALLYGFQSGRITYSDGVGEAANRYYFECDERKITDAEGRWINSKNVAQLLSWLRNEDEIVEEWSERFDRDIQRQKHSLPSLASENANELSKLTGSLTGTTFMQLLTEKLYVDPTTKKSKAGKKITLVDNGSKVKIENRVGPTALEFAYMIKTSEELGRDCDDAERILNVIYNIFNELCSYRTNPENSPECYIHVYKQQTGKVFESLASAKTVVDSAAEAKAHFKQIVTWLNQTGVFNMVSADTPMDEKGNVCINTPFNSDDNSNVKKILEYIRTGGKDLSEEDVSESVSDDETVVG